MNLLRNTLAAAALVVGFAAGAQAAVINGSDFTNGLNNQVIGGITWTSSPGNFRQKSIPGGFTGVGITGGATGDEIDIGETLTATPLSALLISSITFGVLYNGPEFGDFLEVALTTIDGSQQIRLTTVTDTTATLTGAAGTVTNLSPANSGGGAVWRIDFAPTLSAVTSIAITAEAGLCGFQPCTSQSDFTLVQLVTVPEPASLVLFGAGLVGLGLARRRRAAV